MRYALLINERPGANAGLSEAGRAAITAEYLALRADPRVFAGERLQPAHTATTVRDGGGELLLTDGPFADTKEIFGGFYLLEAANLDEALIFNQGYGDGRADSPPRRSGSAGRSSSSCPTRRRRWPCSR